MTAKNNGVEKQKRPTPVILGTDWYDDCDDCAAIRLLTQAQKEGLVDILGINIDACMPESVRSLSVFLRKCGLPEIPIGLDANATDFGNEGMLFYQHRLACETDDPAYPDNASAEDGVRLYRRLLAGAQEPVELYEIGFSQVLANLLLSPPDDLSPLCGRELFAAKVRKVWMMAGRWDDGENRLENNICRNHRSRVGAATLFAACPVPITFMGFEASYNVLSGGHLPKTDFLRQTFLDYKEPGAHPSYDPMLVLMAVIGNEETAGYTRIRGWASVSVDTGECFFRQDPEGPHGYVRRKFDPSYYSTAIDNILSRAAGLPES